MTTVQTLSQLQCIFMDPLTPLQAVETDSKNVFLFLIICACGFVNVCLHSTELGIRGLEQDL